MGSMIDTTTPRVSNASHIPSVNDVMIDSDDLLDSDSHTTSDDIDYESEENDDSESADNEYLHVRNDSLMPHEEEKNICVRIAKVLYENSWTGEMIADSAEFSRREFNALLECGNVMTDSFISNLVWKIIFYSQKKSEDELINEDKAHNKWYWYDTNDISSDWKWRKYNVIICQWISDQYKLYLTNNNDDEMIIDFKKCQDKFEKDHRQNIVKSMRNRPEIKEDYDEDDEKQEMSNKKKKKITIDAFFDVNSAYDHFLVIQRDNIWHKIKGSDNREYSREIRLEYKLFDIKSDMIVTNYQPNPSPFAIPNLLAVDA